AASPANAVPTNGTPMKPAMGKKNNRAGPCRYPAKRSLKKNKKAPGIRRISDMMTQRIPSTFKCFSSLARAVAEGTAVTAAGAAEAVIGGAGAVTSGSMGFPQVLQNFIPA